MTAETLEPTKPPAPVLAPVVPATYVPVAICRCGHEQDAHEHYRPGHDCGVCGPVRCRRYARRTARGARSSFRR